jgi:hypothetical protein
VSKATAYVRRRTSKTLLILTLILEISLSDVVCFEVPHCLKNEQYVRLLFVVCCMTVLYSCLQNLGRSPVQVRGLCRFDSRWASAAMQDTY